MQWRPVNSVCRFIVLAKRSMKRRKCIVGALLAVCVLPLLLAKAPAAAEPRVVYTRDVLAPGHERAHPELCPAQGAQLALLVLVASAPANFARRDRVRLTWGHYAARSDVALAFVLGMPPDGLTRALHAEDQLYGDLIFGRFLDSYTNLTLKVLSMLEWAATYCPRVPRLLKTDDDMFINVPRLLEFASAPDRVNTTRTVWGRVWSRGNLRPNRATRNKYYLSPLQFAGKKFPSYASGGAYLMTADCVRPLLSEAPAQPYIRLEDVFVTGVLSARLGIQRVHVPEFYNRKVSSDPCTVQRAVSIHILPYNDLKPFHLWSQLHFHSKCSQPTA